MDGAEQLAKVIEPIMKSTFNIRMKNTISAQHNLTEKNPSERKQRQIKRVMKKFQNPLTQ